jgi:hypothetical protein
MLNVMPHIPPVLAVMFATAAMGILAVLVVTEGAILLTPQVIGGGLDVLMAIAAAWDVMVFVYRELNVFVMVLVI